MRNAVSRTANTSMGTKRPATTRNAHLRPHESTGPVPVAGGIVEELRRNLLGLDTHGFYHFVALEKTKDRAVVSALLPIAPGSGGQTVAGTCRAVLAGQTSGRCRHQ